MPDPVTAIIGGTLGSAASNIFGAQSGAKAQREAAQQANTIAEQRLAQGLDTQKSYFDSGNALLKDVGNTGTDVYKQLVSQLPDLTAPVTMDQATLEATPGYQFNVQQGNRAIDLSAISRGMSGAQAKAAAQFGVNTANTLYKDQWDIANQNKTNAFNRLFQTANIGTQAATSLGANSTSAGNAALGAATGVGKTESDNLVGAGKATAAADTATGAQVGNLLQTGAGLYANGNNINKQLSMYGRT